MLKNIIVPVSGGKDSQACIKLACEEYGVDNVMGLFCDTQFEHPITYQHIHTIADLYGVEISKVTAGSVEEKVLKYGRFPGGGARHCTDELKIKPSKEFYKQYAEKWGCTKEDSFEVWYGVRSDESAARKKRYEGKAGSETCAPHEYMPSKYPQYLYKKYGIVIRMPIIDWSREEVMEYLDGEQNPLYEQGFDRVGCFPCLAGGDKWKETAFSFDEFGEEQKKKVIWLENQIGKSIWTSKGGKQRNSPGCSVCEI